MHRRSVVSANLDPTREDVWAQESSRPTNEDALMNARRKSMGNKKLTGASALTVRQSIVPCLLVTVLFFLWGFAYGMLDTLNAKFQVRGEWIPPKAVAPANIRLNRNLSTSLPPELVVCKPLTSEPTLSDL